MIMSLCEELDSEDSGASLSAAATVSAKKKKTCEELDLFD